MFLQIRTYVHYGITYQPGGVSVAEEITYTATAAIAVLLWSWACGFVLASLSGRTLWITSLLLYCIVQDSWAIRLYVAGGLVLKHALWRAMLLRLLPFEPAAIAFLFVLALGIRSARKGTVQRNTRLCLTAVGLSLVFLLVWMDSWFAAGFAHWSGQSYLPTPVLYRLLPCLAGAWPVFSIPLLDGRRQQPGQRAA